MEKGNQVNTHQAIHHQPIAVGYNRNSAILALMEKHADRFAKSCIKPVIDYAACRRIAAMAKASGSLVQLTIDEQAEKFRAEHPTEAAIAGRPRSNKISAAVNELLTMGDTLPFGAISQVAHKHGANVESVRARYIAQHGKPTVVRNQATAKAVEWLLKQRSVSYGIYSVAARMFGASAPAVRNRYITKVSHG